MLYVPVINAHESFFVFGGGYSLGTGLDDLSIIAKLDSNGVWSDVGSLKVPRYAAKLTFVDNAFLYTGGVTSEPTPTEKCVFKDNVVSCKNQAPLLHASDFIQHILLVSSYCK